MLLKLKTLNKEKFINLVTNGDGIPKIDLFSKITSKKFTQLSKEMKSNTDDLSMPLFDFLIYESGSSYYGKQYNESYDQYVFLCNHFKNKIDTYPKFFESILPIILTSHTLSKIQYYSSDIVKLPMDGSESVEIQLKKLSKIKDNLIEEVNYIFRQQENRIVDTDVSKAIEALRKDIEKSIRKTKHLKPLNNPLGLGLSVRTISKLLTRFTNRKLDLSTKKFLYYSQLYLKEENKNYWDFFIELINVLKKEKPHFFYNIKHEDIDKEYIKNEIAYYKRKIS